MNTAVSRAARALYAEGTRHIANVTPFPRLDPAIRAVWERRARVALTAAFPALEQVSERGGVR